VEPVERSDRPQDNATCSLAAAAEYMSVGNMQTDGGLTVFRMYYISQLQTYLDLFYALLTFLEKWVLIKGT